MNLTYNNHTWTDDTLLTAHAVLVAQVLGNSSWAALDYQTDLNALVAWLAVLESHATKRSVHDVMQEIQGLPLSKLLACLTKE